MNKQTKTSTYSASARFIKSTAFTATLLLAVMLLVNPPTAQAGSAFPINAPGEMQIIITGEPPSHAHAWQVWNETDLNNNGAPFWDNPSIEGNIGYCLTGTEPCVGLANPPGAIPFLGHPFDAATDTGGFSYREIHFKSNTFTTYTAVLEGENASGAFSEHFGWFETDQSGSYVGTLHLLLNGSDPIGTAVSYQPTQYYGFYMVTYDGETWYTLSKYNLTDTGKQHFAIFSTQPGSPQTVFWFGLEDSPGFGDKDYNDLIISVSSSHAGDQTAFAH